jgi:hypothetical protein
MPFLVQVHVELDDECCLQYGYLKTRFDIKISNSLHHIRQHINIESETAKPLVMKHTSKIHPNEAMK